MTKLSIPKQFAAFSQEPFGNVKKRKPKLSRALKIDLLVLLLICAICLSVFFSFYTARIIAETEETRLATMETCLDFAVESTDYLFDVCIGQPLEEASRNYSIIALSFSSSSFNINDNALARGKSYLNGMAANSPLIGDAFLYVPNADLVLSSSYTSTHLNASIYYNIIWTYESGLAELSPLSICDDAVSVFRFGDEYIIVRDLFSTIGHKQSTLFLILDVDEINRYIKASVNDNENVRIFLYAHDENQVFTDPAEKNDLFDPLEIELNEQKITITENGLCIIGRQSDATTFNYYLTVDEAFIRPGFFSMLPTVIPFAFLLFLMVCLIAAFATLTLYKPFHSAVTKLEESDIPLPKDAHLRNEFDYLNSAITSIVSRQSQLQSMLQFVSHDVQTRLFTNLLLGDPINYGDIVSTLESMDSPFKLNSVYVAIAAEYADRSATDKKSMAELHGWLNECMSALYEKYDLSFDVIQAEPDRVAVVVQFNDLNTTIVNGKHVLLNIKNAMEDLFRRKKCSCLLEAGQLYHSVLDVGLSYKEAVEMITLGKELNAAADQWADLSAPDGSERTMASLLSHRVNQLITACSEGSEADLPQLITHTISEISDATSDCVQLFQIIKDLLNICVSQIVSYNCINLSMIPDVYSEFCNLCADCEQPELLLKHAQDAVQKLIDAFLSQLRKQRNPYILETQKFIKAHYAEPDLSLDDIAANVRLSASYLSKLFSNSLGMKLFEYLTRFRIEASLDMLLNTRKTVAEIALLSGFTSSRNYIRAFKIYCGETPGEYRKSH